MIQKLRTLTKSEQCDVMNILLWTQDRLRSIAVNQKIEFVDDRERYLKIALKIEPNDPDFLTRNENNELDLNL